MPGRSDGPRRRDRLAALISGDPDAWDFWAVRSPRELMASADAHGVLPLVVEVAAGQSGCPSPLREALGCAVRQRVAFELLREHELRRLVDAFHGAAVPVLLLKGADLAYARYARPDLRPRTDTDLLVEPGARGRARAVLEALGYGRVPQTGGDLLMYQEPYRLLRDGVPVHVVDLHWRVFNPQRYGRSFTYERLAHSSEPRPALSSHARGLDVSHALALACVHRIAHHFDGDRLIWLVDIRVMAESMTEAQWQTFAAFAAERSIEAECWHSLDAARRLVGARVPGSLLTSLRARLPADVDRDPFLEPGASHLRRVLSDFRLVGGWAPRIRLARQHLFPSADYMVHVYAPASRAPVWLLYLTRILRGSRRWLVGS